jgi:hypothetical protein
MESSGPRRCTTRKELSYPLNMCVGRPTAGLGAFWGKFHIQQHLRPPSHGDCMAYNRLSKEPFVKESLTSNEIHIKFIKVYGDSSPSF